jgi:Skp family chaperone for outer membrane proteins
MRHILTLAAVSAAALSLPATALAQAVPAAVVVVVDTNRVSNECNACKTAIASLRSQAQALQTRQQTLATQLRPEGEAIQKEIDALAGKAPSDALKTRAQAFQKKEQDAQEELERGRQNLQAIQANVLRQINDKMEPAISQVMSQRGANLAVDVGATLAHAPAVDVTNAVLAAVNATLPSVSMTAPAQPAQSTTQGR